MTRVKWKWMFIVLLAFNVILITGILILINRPVKDEKIVENTENQNQNEIEFQVKTNRDDLNRLINQYLEKEGLTEKFQYEVYVTDTVDLYGKIPFFNRELDLKLTFNPIAQKNGDIILEQEFISVGDLNLPVSYVMNFLKNKYKMPDGVTIQPEKQNIYVSLHDLKLKSNIHVKAQKIDLKNNDIIFLLTVPSLQSK